MKYTNFCQCEGDERTELSESDQSFDNEESTQKMAAGIERKAHQGTDGSPPDDAGNSPSSSIDQPGKLVTLLHLTQHQQHYSGYRAATMTIACIFFKCHPTFTVCTVLESGVLSVKRNF